MIALLAPNQPGPCLECLCGVDRGCGNVDLRAGSRYFVVAGDADRVDAAAAADDGF